MPLKSIRTWLGLDAPKEFAPLPETLDHLDSCGTRRVDTQPGIPYFQIDGNELRREFDTFKKL